MTHNTRFVTKMLSASCLGLAFLVIAASAPFTPAVAAQQPPAPQPAQAENSGVKQSASTTGPITVKWRLKKVNGTANLIVNPDGTYLFSGTVKDKQADRDLDITIALKSSLGGVILFQYAGNAADGVQWSKQGQDPILKDNFQTFASKTNWDGAYRLPLSKEGVAKLYEEREKKQERLKKEEEEARKRHDEKLAAEKKKEREQEAQKEAEEAQQQHSGGGGGSSVASVIGTIGTVVGSILAFL
jgi:hypothetical protein